MKIKKFILSEFEVNSYLIINGSEGILIDVGYPISEIIRYIEEHKIDLKAILLTHTHLDHISGLNELRERVSAPVYVHEKEQHWLSDPGLNGSNRFPFLFGEIKALPAEFIFNSDQLINIGPFEIKVIHTPGHTPGGISYYIKPWLFSGDTLFYQSIGRTDLYGGDLQQLKRSIKNKLFSLPDDTIIFPGHGEKSVIKREKGNNPYVGKR